MMDVKEAMQAIVSEPGGQCWDHFIDERGFMLERNGNVMNGDSIGTFLSEKIRG